MRLLQPISLSGSKLKDESRESQAVFFLLTRRFVRDRGTVSPGGVLPLAERPETGEMQSCVQDSCPPWCVVRSHATLLGMS